MRLTQIAEDIGRQLLTYGRRIPLPELFAWVNAVDASSSMLVANRIIFDQDVAISAVGPIKKLPDCNWFRRAPHISPPLLASSSALIFYHCFNLKFHLVYYYYYYFDKNG
ncbi:putative metalloenzyme, LuxS/M16 peptidase [Dioscorea sansibarensis]